MTTKPYSTDDAQQSQHVSEPAVSYGIQKDAARIKLEAIDELMNIFDPDRLSQALAYLHSLGREEEKESCPPCQYTPDELKKRVSIAMEQSRKGLGISQNEMRRRKPVWR